jgi:hypothetical protein
MSEQATPRGTGGIGAAPVGAGPRDGDVEPRNGRFRWWLVFLLAPFVALLYPPFYAMLTPRLAGIPFFIWYQFLWVVIGVVITGIVYAFDRVTGG